MASILIIDDEKTVRKQLYWQLSDAFTVYEAGTIDEARAILAKTSIDLALIDLHMPPDLETPRSGLDLLAHVRIQHPRTIPIIMTGMDDHDMALHVIDQGAWDQFTKPVNPDELAVVMRRALRIRSMADELETLKDGSKTAGDGHLIGGSAAIQAVCDLIVQVAPTDATVLITGESGTGKELVAQSIHTKSLRAAKPMVAVNCAALSDSLIEDELFGHEAGAYTGSKGPRKGKFEMADGGTLFLDEVAELSPTAQAKLLRVLQEGTLERLGSERSLKVDVRVIAATHQDLTARVREGRFREDLYYRLSVIPIHVPRLAERGSDVLLLANHFLTHYRKRLNKSALSFSDAALRALQTHHWPGNVRELRNLVERCAILARGAVIEADELPLEFQQNKTAASAFDDNIPVVLPEGMTYEDAVNRYRRQLLEQALRTHKSKSKVAQALGINRSYLYELLEKLGLSGDE